MASEAEARDVFASVLALKALPELASAHPDDLIGLASRTRERRLAAGEALAEEGEASVLFLLEGRLRDPSAAARGAVHDAPAVVGLLTTLAGDPLPAFVAETDVVALETPRSELLDALEEEFELWAAVLRAACARALALRRAEPAAALVTHEAPACDPAEIAERIVLLRRTAPFDGLPVALLGQLAAEMEPLTVPPGAVLFEPDDPATRALAIVAGAALVRTQASGPARRLGPGAVVGLTETLAGGRCGCRLEAATELQALVLDGEALIDALEDDVASAVELLCALARHERDARRSGPDAIDGAACAGGGRG